MEDCWQILGLDPNTATEKDVKSAYARMLKQNRPDVNPEGFQQVRRAYEAALGEVRNWSVEMPHPVAAEVSPPADRAGLSDVSPGDMRSNEGASGAPVPSQMQDGMVAGAMDGFAGRIQEAWFPWTRHRLFHKVMEAMDAAKLDGPARSRLWLDAFGFDGVAFAKCAPDFVLIALLKLHESSIVAATVNAWVASRNWSRVARLGRNLDRHAKELSPEHGHFVAQVAGLLALHYPHTAECLANVSFVMLGQHERREAISHVESRLAHGRVLKLLPRRLRRYWMKIVQENTTLENSWRNRRKISRTAHAMLDSWSGWQVLQPHLSDPLWEYALRSAKRESWWARRLVTFRLLRPRYWMWYLLPVMGVSLLVLHVDNKPRPPRQPSLYNGDIPVTAAEVRNLRAKKASKLAGLMSPELEHSIRIWRSDFGVVVPASGSLAHDASAISIFAKP